MCFQVSDTAIPPGGRTVSLLSVCKGSCSNPCPVFLHVIGIAGNTGVQRRKGRTDLPRVFPDATGRECYLYDGKQSVPARLWRPVARQLLIPKPPLFSWTLRASARAHTQNSLTPSLSHAHSCSRAWIGWIVCTEFVWPRPLLEKLELDDPSGQRPSVSRISWDAECGVAQATATPKPGNSQGPQVAESTEGKSALDERCDHEAVPGMDDLLGFEELREASLCCVTDVPSSRLSRQAFAPLGIDDTMQASDGVFCARLRAFGFRAEAPCSR